MFIIVGAIEYEVGWLGTSRKVGDLQYTIDDVFLFEQDVSYGHTELQTEGMTNTMVKLLEKPDGEEIFNNMRFWGHSHGDGGTWPSFQDDKSMNIFRNFNASYAIRGIFSRRGETNLGVYDYEKGMAYHKVPWTMKGPRMSADEVKKLTNEIHEEMLNLVVHRPAPVYAPNNFYRSSKRGARRWDKLKKIAGSMGMGQSQNPEVY
jgi:hypothetical protein